ncbi:MAG: DUF5786 family protein [Natronomonas sp.]
MGFGSYDESDQPDQNVEIEDDGGENVHENDYDGEMSFDSDTSTDELLDQFAEMREE